MNKDEKKTVHSCYFSNKVQSGERFHKENPTFAAATTTAAFSYLAGNPTRKRLEAVKSHTGKRKQ